MCATRRACPDVVRTVFGLFEDVSDGFVETKKKLSSVELCVGSRTVDVELPER